MRQTGFRLWTLLAMLSVPAVPAMAVRPGGDADPPCPVQTRSVVPNRVPAYKPADCPTLSDPTVLRIHFDIPKLLFGRDCRHCVMSAIYKDGKEKEDAELPSAALKMTGREWPTSIDANIRKHPHWHKGNLIMVEVILDSPGFTFFYPNDPATDSSADSDFAVREDDAARDSSMFTCREPIAKDVISHHDMIRFRARDIDGLVGGLNIGFLTVPHQGLNRVPFYIDPHIGNKG